MEDYIFQEGLPPQDYHQDFHPALFNTHHYRVLQHEAGWHSFYALNKRNKQILAVMHFHVQDGFANSPLKAPFGSVELSRELPNTILFEFIGFIESRLKALGATTITIKCPPSSYSPDHQALLETFLFNHGFAVKDAEAGSVIQVSDNNFESYPDSWERRKLRQSHEAGLKFERMELDQLASAYLFILTCRKQRGYSLSMTLAELKSTVSRFKNDYMLFGVFNDEDLAAASIAVRVRKNILYNFYSAHSPAYDNVSPVVMLVEGLYDFCQHSKIRLLDLGTSANNGTPNFGLLDFKLRLGARPTTKLVFEKRLS